jgi:hypothetical protein
LVPFELLLNFQGSHMDIESAARAKLRVLATAKEYSFTRLGSLRIHFLSDLNTSPILRVFGAIGSFPDPVRWTIDRPGNCS